MILAPEPRTTMVCCPACNGEGRVEVGDDYTDRDTGARSPITAPCDECHGTGGVEVELQPIDLDDLSALIGMTGEGP